MHANWIKQAVSGGGTGNITLISGGASFIDLNTRFGTSNYFRYVIEDGNNREAGIGHLSAANTLVRDVPLEVFNSGTYSNSNAGSTPTPINVTTSAIVSCSNTTDSFVGSSLGVAAVTGFPKYIGNALATSPASPIGLSAGWVCVESFLLPCGGLFSGMSFNVTTAGAGNAVAGLYECINDTQISKIAQCAEFSCSTTGQKTSSFSAPVFLSPGFYLMVINNAVSANFTADSNARGLLTIEPSNAANVQSRANAQAYNATMPQTLDMSAASWGNYNTSAPRCHLLKV